MNDRRVGALTFLLTAVLIAGLAAAPADHPAPKIDVYFSPHGGCTDAIVRTLDSARSSVLVQAYSFTSAPIAPSSTYPCTDRSVQHLPMDAFDGGIVTTQNLPRVRNIIEDRLGKGKALGSKKATAPYTLDKLKRDISRITREKEAFVYEAGQRENRLMRVLDERPQLKGNYAL